MSEQLYTLEFSFAWVRFNVKNIFIQTIQFSISTQFNYQKHFYFKLFSLVKQF